MNSTHVDTFVETAHEWGEKIIEWATPAENTAGYTKDWPLASFEAALGIAIAYFLFVVIGSAIFKLKATPALDLYGLRFVYNIGQVMLCSYMCIEAGMVAYRNNYSIIPCNEFDSINPPVANVLWLFYVSKVFDFFDTFFIVTRKKWQQLSFLHVYHHLTIFLFYWLNLNVGYDGDVYLTIVLNGFIHTVMYTYYFVAMHTRDIWWKKYMTQMQMVQFLTMMAQAFYLLLTGCTKYPRRVVLAYNIYIFSLLVLFFQFYLGAYSKKKPSTAKSGVKKGGKGN